MGCNPSRPTNNPIIVSSIPQNTILDNKITKVDHRVLSKKFIPIKQNNHGIQIEAVEALDILAFDPRNGVKHEYEISGIPHYSVDNITLNGKWLYIENWNSLEKECTFERETQHKIEKEFIKGSLRCEFKLYENFAEIIFKDMIVLGNRKDGSGKKEHFAYPIKRTPMRREGLGWNASDGVIRPICKEIEDILNFTHGVYTFRFENSTITIDMEKKAFIDSESALAKPLIKL
ncbi:hypothetical protein SteCoe_3610 [Stentor coeruleus]|uniref:Uncharacterized protein n=1 Tax=Stentor coeruleus TaxID=5963 RepID=A0A1R2CWJ5_9CILI|nr:hypothetical protein SteCoe_3610 [Stentor coeruleus]